MFVEEKVVGQIWYENSRSEGGLRPLNVGGSGEDRKSGYQNRAVGRNRQNLGRKNMRNLKQ